MLIFRKAELEDLDKIYSNDVLRSLITVENKGQKFMVVLDENGCLYGGVSGYIDADGALIQKIILQECEQKELLKDGLLRSLIHILERDGIKILFALDNEHKNLYDSIGFKNYPLQKIQEYYNLGNILLSDLECVKYKCIDLKEFFDRPGCK